MRKGEKIESKSMASSSGHTKEPITGITLRTAIIRSSPSPYTMVLEPLPPGTIVDVLDLVYDYYKIQFGDKVGYIYTENLSIVQDEISERDVTGESGSISRSLKGVT